MRRSLSPAPLEHVRAPCSMRRKDCLVSVFLRAGRQKQAAPSARAHVAHHDTDNLASIRLLLSVHPRQDVSYSTNALISNC